MGQYKASFVQSEPYGSLDAQPASEAVCEVWVEAESELEAADALFGWANSWDPQSLIGSKITRVTQLSRAGQQCNMKIDDFAVVTDTVDAVAWLLRKTVQGWRMYGKIRLELEIIQEPLDVPQFDKRPHIKRKCGA